MFVFRALLRPGRFDTEVHLYLPDMRGRKEIFNHYLDKVKVHNSECGTRIRGSYCKKNLDNYFHC